LARSVAVRILLTVSYTLTSNAVKNLTLERKVNYVHDLFY